MNPMHAGFYQYLALVSVIGLVVFLAYVFLGDENDEIVFTIPIPDFIAKRFK
jgi:hypothetical protein